MENNTRTKNLIMIFVLLLILLIIPLSLYLVGQKQEIRKKASEFPQSVVMLPSSVDVVPGEEFTLNLMIRKAGLQKGKLDAGDIVIGSCAELIPTSDGKPVLLNANFPSSLEVTKNEIQTDSLVFSFHTKLIGGTRASYIPASDLMIGTIKFRSPRSPTGSCRSIYFDQEYTNIAGGGINTTNFNRDGENVALNFKTAISSILRVFPSNILTGYQTQPIEITGKGFENSQIVEIFGTTGTICSNPQASANGTKLTCNLPAEIPLGAYNINLLDSQNRILAVLEKGLNIIEPTTPLLKFKVRLFGVNAMPTGANINQRAKLLAHLTMNPSREFRKSNVLLTATTSGNLVIFESKYNESEKIDDRIPLFKGDYGAGPSFETGTADIFIKGPKHLQKKFTVNLTGGENIIERLADQSRLVGGDLPLSTTYGQDGRINSMDYNYYICGQKTCARNNNNSLFGSTDPSVLNIADINLNGQIDQGDSGSIIEAWSEKLDEDE